MNYMHVRRYEEDPSPYGISLCGLDLHPAVYVAEPVPVDYVPPFPEAECPVCPRCVAVYRERGSHIK